MTKQTRIVVPTYALSDEMLTELLEVFAYIESEHTAGNLSTGLGPMELECRAATQAELSWRKNTVFGLDADKNIIEVGTVRWQ